MPRRPDQMNIGLFLQETGHHIAAWRHPSAQVDDPVNFERYRESAVKAEAAKLDFVFLADTIAVREQNPAILSRTARGAHFEPLPLLSALAMVTQRLGLIATASTTYNAPYHIARKFASLDHLSGGRAGWNLVTTNSAIEAGNFGTDPHPPHADRYARAHEFAAVARGLWDSWEDDAFLWDKESGRYFDAGKLHALDHHGRYYDVKGPLNVSRPPQGYPVLVQAGSSDTGRALAAETAEVIFTAQQEISDAQAFYADVKARVAAFGRDPAHLRIMPGMMPIIGRTSAEAEEKFQYLQSLIHPTVALAQLSAQVGGFDFSPYPLDGPLPAMPETNGPKSRQRLLVDLARRENLTLRQLAFRNAGSRGHLIIRGSADEVADQLEAWFTGHACDGFNLMPSFFPDGLDEFVTLVLPELKRRGLFRTDYPGTTLRDTLGLPRPAHPAARSAPAYALAGE